MDQINSAEDAIIGIREIYHKSPLKRIEEVTPLRELANQFDLTQCSAWLNGVQEYLEHNFEFLQLCQYFQVIQIILS